jgi:hypothetical protein
LRPEPPENYEGTWGKKGANPGPLADYEITGKFGANHASSGRQMRVLAHMHPLVVDGAIYLYGLPVVAVAPNERLTYRWLLGELKDNPFTNELLSGIPLRRNPSADRVYTKIPEAYHSTLDAQVDSALHDLARQIRWDLTLACESLSNPDVWYPGVDEGIEPVDDEHVKLVMWALHRELARERRPPLNPDGTPNVMVKRLKPVDPREFPWRIQRALAERRRLRYQQWGIGRKQWENNEWSLWDVQEDPDWVPPWVS